MDNVCRTCLRIPDNLTSLYVDTTLINKIETISSIQLVVSDEYPSHICQECITNVNILYNFRKVIINSDRELKERCELLQRTKSLSKAETEIEIEDSIIKDECEDDVYDDSSSNVDQGEDYSSNVDPGDNSCHSQNEEVHEIKKILINLNTHECTICNRTFSSRYKLHRHKRLKHVAMGVCNVCGMVVRTDNLKRHIELHLAKPVNCEHCGKKFKNSESLRGHKLIHKGIIYTCEICEKSYKVKSEYKRHLKSHTDPEVGKVMCTLCGKRVKDLKKHMYSHTGERPYLCVHCMKGFTSTYSLKVHTRQHTNEKPFICEYCPMAFPQKVSLTSHIKSKHQKSDLQ